MELAVNLVGEDATLRKRVILLTDGEITEGGSRDEVIELAKEAIVHTLGLSNAADADLLQKTADAGRGTFSLIEDYESGRVLNGKVISALKRCLEPALEKCSLTWGDEVVELNTVFRNQLVQDTRIFKQSDFDDLTVSFTCENDPTTNQPINLEFNSGDFVQVSEQQSLNLFKIAAMNLPELTQDQAIKYQVLSDTTAFIGVVEQENTDGGEAEEIETIQFGRGVVRTAEPEFGVFEEDFAFAQPFIGGGGLLPQPSFSGGTGGGAFPIATTTATTF